MKGIISAILVMCVLLTAVPIISAATFPDVTSRHSWALDAIDNMASRGILKGFPDGKFMPDNSITKLDALIIASRIMGYADSANEKYIQAALSAYEKDLEAYSINYKGEVAYLLYWGVLSPNELSSYIADSVRSQPMRRHEAAVLLTKMMGAEQQAFNSSIIILNYSDEESIPSSSKPYVKYVDEAGIMNGMDDNTFVPLGEVTRAMMATMMFRAENLMKKSAIDATITMIDSSANIITVKESTGEEYDVDIPSGVALKIDGKDSRITSLISGISVRLHFRGEDLVLVEAIASDVQYITYGVVRTTSSNTGSRSITFVEPGDPSAAPKVLALSNSCGFTVDGSSANFSSIRADMYVKITVKSGVVTEIAAETKETSYNGTINKVTLGEQVSVNVTLKDGTVRDFAFSSNTLIYRNGSVAEGRSIAEGDTVVIAVQNGAVKRIDATSQTKQVTGVIDEIKISSSPSITVTSGGKSLTYNVTSDTVFIIDNTESTIYDMRLGANATITLDSSNIKRISTESLVMSNVLVGTVTYIHPTSYVMGVEVTGATGKIEQVQAVVKSNVTITDASTTKINQFKNITVGRKVVVTGSVKYGVFEVSTITITD